MSARWILRIAIFAGLSALLLAESLAAEEVDGSRGLRRQSDYSGLWPFYSQEVYENGAERRSSLFGLFRAETEPGNAEKGGDWHHHLLPFYCASLSSGRTDDQLALYPLLYLRRRSTSNDHDVVLPLFYSWRAGEARHSLLWPLFQSAQDPEPGPYRWIPVLYRRGTFHESGETLSRLGVPAIFELFESRSGRDRRAFTIATLFNFNTETLSGVSLGRFEQSPERGREAFLIPLFALRDAGENAHVITPLAAVWRRSSGRRGWAVPPLLSGGTWDEGGHDVHVLWPLLRFRDDVVEHEDRVLPFFWGKYNHAAGSWSRFYSIFFGRVEQSAEQTRDDYYPLFLSHTHSSPSDWGIDVVWPLGCYYEESAAESNHVLRALPFYDRTRNSRGDWMGVGGMLYRRHQTFSDDTVSQWALWPLVHWRTSPPGRLEWFLPFFYHKDELWGETRSQATFIFPSYFSSVEESEQPARDGTAVEISSHTHLWPLFGFDGRSSVVRDRDGLDRGAVESATYSTLYPFFQHARSREPASDVDRWSLETPWPLVHFERTAGSFDFRVFPPFYTGSAPDRTYLYLYPALAVEAGSGARESFWSATSILQWHGGEDEQRFDLFPLIFRWRELGDRSLTVAGPLYLLYFRSSQSPQSGWFHLLPLVFGAWSEAGSGFGIFPLYYQRDHGTEPVNYWSPARFFFAWNSISNQEESHWSLLWKLCERTSRRNGDHELRILHRLFVSRSVEGQRELVVNPFYSHFVDDRTGRSSFSVLQFLFRHESDGDGERASVLFLPIWSRKR